MKKNENKKTNRNRSLVALLVLCALLAVTLVGCKKPVAEKPEPSTSEVVSEVVSEEVSEPVSEVVSEKPSEEEMDLTPYTNANGKKAIDLAKDMEYDEFKIIVWRANVGAKTILSDGDTYELQDKDDLLTLYLPNKMTDIQFNEYAKVTEGTDFLSGLHVIGCGENLEITITGTDVDGKEYEITFYVTKDWKYEWE